MAKETETKTPAAKARMIACKVGPQGISEGGSIYPSGSAVELPADRVKALGSLVTEQK